MRSRTGQRLRRRSAVIAAVACAVAAALSAGGAAVGSGTAGTSGRVGSPCKGSTQIRCLTVPVPLDRSGSMQGKVSLEVELLPASGRPRGVVFLLAGGPGQAGTEFFDFRSPLVRAIFQAAFPGYTLVAYDIRGTGRSGALRCPHADLDSDAPDVADQVARCAAAIGPRRDFYGTADHAEDLEAVRSALGSPSIAVAAVSYGTELAVAYARAHPDRVERLMLDSVAPVGGRDPFSSRPLSRIPATLTRFCGRGDCKAATPGFARDVAALANALERKPARGTVRLADGRQKRARLDEFGFLSLVFNADLSPGLAAELPAATRAARSGNPLPLLRLTHLLSGGSSPTAGMNNALYVATVCRDGRFPWPPEATLAERRTLVAEAVRALPAAALGGFGRWVTQIGDASTCIGWPTPAGGSTLSTGPLPDVPVLALSGDFDMRTPTSYAAALVSGFPHGRLLVFPGVGHSALTSDTTGCAITAVRDWMTDRVFEWRDGCPRRGMFLAPLGPFPSGPATPDGGDASPARTLSLAERTLHEAVASWLVSLRPDGGITTVPGLVHGTISASIQRIKLTRYSLVPGISLTGRVTLSTRPPFRFTGTLEVKGPRAAEGLIFIDGKTARGVLGGHHVRHVFCILQC